ncbi:MAG: sigma-70 family RNA polymerase sigma factor [Acidobacteria bacterium]|nr:sigma-70 family RNA polymerase sigma factor [Acidobacteriota bacterium]
MAVGEVRPDVTGLVREAQAGSTAAFSELVRLHQDEVFTLAYRLTGDAFLAADVAQDAFVRAWRAIAGFRADARFSTWLHRITVNVAWTERSRQRRRGADSIDDLVHEPAAAGPSTERLAVDAAFGSSLASALLSLPIALRSVVVLKDVYGWSHAEIAEDLAITVTSSKVRLHRARRLLRERIDRESLL